MFNIIRRHWSPQELEEQSAHPGRPAKTLAGSWVSDLAHLHKAIVLCDMCIHKWKPDKYGYRQRPISPGYDWVLGDCDGCKRVTRGHLLTHVTSKI